MKLRVVWVVIGFLVLVTSLAAQTPGGSTASAEVPPLIQFANVAMDEGGNTLSGVESITFSLYTGQRGGEPLWTEIQKNVQIDPTGHYSVQLGITKPKGVPTTLFTAGEARWLGVKIGEQAELPRVLLLSVPYALKAGDAATIGGLPPSAFVLAAPSASLTMDSTQITSSAAGVFPSVIGTGKAGYIPLWTNDTGTLADSALFQAGTSSAPKIGIGTITPASMLDVEGGTTIRGTLSLPATGKATASTGMNSQPLNLAASVFNSSTSTPVAQTFQWRAEPTHNNTKSASGSLNLLFGQGTAKATETGLTIASNGQITFATGQTFPGAGYGNNWQSSTISVKGGAVLGVVSHCGTGNIAISGACGYPTGDASALFMKVVYSGPSPGTPEGWQCSLQNTDTVDHTMTYGAFCITPTSNPNP